MEENGRLRDIRNKLNILRVPELKAVLAELNLSRYGRKQELVDRIAVALKQFQVRLAESNAATSAFYKAQLTKGLDIIDQQMRVNRPTYVLPPQHTRFDHQQSSHPQQAQYNPHRHQTFHPNLAPHGQGAFTNGILPTPNAPTPTAPPPPPTRSIEVHVIRAVPELENARCICGLDLVTSNGGKITRCAACRSAAHAKCFQLVTLTGDWYCEFCRASLFDPFRKVVKTLLKSHLVRFGKTNATYRFEYQLSDTDLNEIYTRRGTTPGSMALQLRCFSINEPLSTGHSWPPSTELVQNGFRVPIIQRAPPGQVNTSKVLRELPAELFSYARQGRNLLELTTKEAQPSLYVFLVQVVQLRSVNDLVDQVKENSKHITMERAKENVIRLFHGKKPLPEVKPKPVVSTSDTNGISVNSDSTSGDTQKKEDTKEDDSDSDDDIVALSTVLSVNCPLSLCRINLPARGLHCQHIQCFDLRSFLLFSQNARSRAWNCTICHKYIKCADLRVDPYLKQLLTEVGDDDDLEEIEILPDASWKRHAQEDKTPASSPPPKKKLKSDEEPMAIKSDPNESTTAGASPSSSTPNGPSATSTTTTNGDSSPPKTSSVSAPAPIAASATSHSGASQPEAIDLTLSDDEDDDDAKEEVGTSSVHANGNARTTTSATEEDDDTGFEIVTVLSDAYHTPSTRPMPTPAKQSVSQYGTNNGSNANSSGGLDIDLAGLFGPPTSSTGQSTTNTDFSEAWNQFLPLPSNLPPATNLTGPPAPLVRPVPRHWNHLVSGVGTSGTMNNTMAWNGANGVGMGVGAPMPMMHQSTSQEDFANAMAILSNSSNVNAAVTGSNGYGSYSMMGSNAMAPMAPVGVPQPQPAPVHRIEPSDQSVLDVISLLDSDSD